ncbi:MAG: hypothetical protein ACI8RT_001163, partial [Candidatus Azotimanducaceae bacterium]
VLIFTQVFFNDLSQLRQSNALQWLCPIGSNGYSLIDAVNQLQLKQKKAPISGRIRAFTKY